MRAIPPDAADHPFPAPILPELDHECGTCQGKALVTNPEWLEWAKRADEAKQAWQQAHPHGSWYASPEGRAIEDTQPAEAELGCVECEFSGYTLTEDGRALLAFLQRHPPALTRIRT